MADFKKGQLVAVRDGAREDWTLKVYDHTSSEGLVFCRWLVHPAPPYPTWSIEAKPAEEVWPNIFLGWERRAREQSDHAVEMESKLVQRLRRQIGWLCKQIMVNALHRKQSDFCPPLDMPTGPNGRCQRSCIACWELASLKAVGEDDNDQA